MRPRHDGMSQYLLCHAPPNVSFFITLLSSFGDVFTRVQSFASSPIYNKVSLLDQPQTLKAQYLSVLYRFGRKALYARRDVSITPSRLLTTVPENAFEATITDVTEQGELVLDTQHFHFKEIQFVL